MLETKRDFEPGQRDRKVNLRENILTELATKNEELQKLLNSRIGHNEFTTDETENSIQALTISIKKLETELKSVEEILK